MIFNMVGGGGGSGATLVVSSPANVSVTVSKDDKSYTKNSGSLGSTTFKGLATGTWAVTISGNGQTATKTVEITADYAITIAFFSAFINITYPANSTCVVTNSGGQTVASDTNAGSSAKTWTATVNATGTYTVTATATDGSGKSKSQSVSITADGQSKSVTLSYEVDIFNNGAIVPFSTQDATSAEVTIGTKIVFSKVSDNPYNRGALAYTTNKVDLTDYNTIVFKGTFTQVIDSNGDKSQVGIMETPAQNKSNWGASTILDTTNNSWTVDISSISGSYHICAFAGNGYTDWLIGSITRIYLA